MDGNMDDLVKNGQKGLLLLADCRSRLPLLVKWVTNTLSGIYTKETRLQWVMRCMDRPRYFYTMFRMSTDIFVALHDLLISNYGLTSTNNVSSMESLAMFL